MNAAFYEHVAASIVRLGTVLATVADVRERTEGTLPLAAAEAELNGIDDDIQAIAAKLKAARASLAAAMLEAPL